MSFPHELNAPKPHPPTGDVAGTSRGIPVTEEVIKGLVSRAEKGFDHLKPERDELKNRLAHAMYEKSYNALERDSQVALVDAAFGVLEKLLSILIDQSTEWEMRALHAESQLQASRSRVRYVDVPGYAAIPETDPNHPKNEAHTKLIDGLGAGGSIY